MKFPITLLALLFTSVIASGQQFKPGYVVNLNRDTLKGNVAYKMIRGSLRQIVFEVPGQKPKTYNAIDIKGAGLEGAHFISAIVSSDKTPKVEQLQKDTVLLDILIDGKMRLLSYKDEDRKAHYYVQREDQSTAELAVHIIFLKDGVHTQSVPQYRFQLANEFPQCQSIHPEIYNSSFDERRFKDLFTKLYECKYHQKPATMVTKRKMTIDWGLTAAASLTTETYPDWFYTFDPVVAPVYGLYLDLKFPTYGKPFYLRTELTYKSYEISSPPTNIPTLSSYTITSTAHIKESHIRLALLGRYFFSDKNVKPFLNLGFSIASVSSEDSEYRVLTLSGNSTASNDDLLTNPKGSSFGFVFGGGVQVKRMGFEFRYETANGLQPTESPVSKNSSLNLFASYSFKKATK